MSDIIDLMYEFLDGKAYTDSEGIAGTFHHEISYPRIYGGNLAIHTITLRPTAEGKATKAYQERKEQYRDDWMTDYTHSEELCQIALDLGFDFDQLESENEL